MGITISANEKKLVKVEERLEESELELIRDFSAHYDLFDEALEKVAKKEGLCEECNQPLADHDDGDCPKKVRED